MKKTTILLFAIIFSEKAMSQEIKFVYQEMTSFDSIKNISDWKKNNLKDNNIDIFSIEDNIKSKTIKSHNSDKWNHEEFHFKYKGIPIEYATLKVHKKEGIIKSINGEYYENISTDVTPIISEKDALEKAKEQIKAELYIWEDDEKDFLIKTNQEYLLNPPNGVLVICKDYLNPENKTLSLAYKFEIYAKKPLSRSYVYVDAKSGKIIHVNSIIKHIDGTAQTRYSGIRTIATNLFNTQFRLRDYDNQRGNGIETYNMNKGTNYSNATDFLDNDNNWNSAEYDNSNKDNAALDAHWGSMMTYDYYRQIHDRNSFDNSGTAIRNYIHYNNNYENAFWDGAVMTFGDGGSDFDALTCLDVTAHEITHGVTEHTANLVYQNESGALNESVSDIFAACVENHVGGASFIDIWTVGEDIDLRQNQSGMRHMWHPFLGGQPDTYLGTSWATGSGDNGGVHTNSGVLNFWFYILSVGGSGFNDFNTFYSVSGISIDKSEQIMYTALTEYFTPNTNYLTASLLTTLAAQEIFGFCSEEVLSVKDAWKAVGLDISLQIPTNLNITQAITTGTTAIYSATNTIVASNIIEENSNVVYRAGSSITLEPGFETKPGVNFEARIEECAENFQNSQNKMAQYSNEEDEINIITNKKEETILNDEKIIFYPNPTNNLINIQIINQEDNDKAILNIFNSIGEIVYRESITNNNFNINLSSFNSGIYFFQITSLTTNKFVKITKQ